MPTPSRMTGPPCSAIQSSRRSSCMCQATHPSLWSMTSTTQSMCHPAITASFGNVNMPLEQFAMLKTDLQRFTAACDYPGSLDEPTVEQQLQAYLSALGVERKIVRLTNVWRLEDHPSIARS